VAAIASSAAAGDVDGGLPLVGFVSRSQAGGNGFVRAPELVVLEGSVRASSSEKARAVRSMRSLHPSALIAVAPGAQDRPFDASGADVLVIPLSAEPEPSARLSLEVGVWAAGRPLLLDVRDPDADSEAIAAALDVGAAGALIHTGSPDADVRIAREIDEAEARRLDGAPLASVIVCNYNGGRYIEGCLGSLSSLSYPSYEVILVDDGSDDDSVARARAFDVRLVEMPRGGLSLARNAGIAAARGEVLAFLDVDAEAQPEWLARIWRLLGRLGVDGTGGPNLPFSSAGWQERVVSGSPGPPQPIVEANGSAIHLAGCNMAFRRQALEQVGGFSALFTQVNDDVDVCLRMIDAGSELAFHPTAAVYHHRRETLVGFLKQQRIYGAATANYEADHGNQGMMLQVERSLLERLDPRRPRYVFAGPQGRQLFTLRTQPLHIGLPVKLLGALLIGGTAGVPLALLLRRRPWTWMAGAGAAVLALVAVVAVRAPAFAPPRGPAGVAQRVATAGVWFAQPLARRYGAWRARRPKPS